jgi:hypothetical protein
VLGYTVRIIGPGVDLSRLVPAGSASLDFNNTSNSLVPGTAYSVSIYARNSAQVAAESAWLRNAPVSVTAVGPPSQADGGVVGVVVNTLGHIRVTWGASSPNGAPGVTYTVGRFEAAEVLPTTCQAPDPGSGSTAISGLTWTDTSVQDQHSYRYVVYADNGLYCTPTASGEVLTMRAPGKAFGLIWLQPHDGQFDIQVRSNLSVASLTAAKFQYDVNGDGAWRDVVANQFLTSMADSSVYGNPMTIRFRGCRDLTDSFCGEPSDGVTRVPVNARASVVSCVYEAQVVSNPPINAGEPTITYLYAFNRGLGFGSYGSSATVPTPIVPVLGEVDVRVKAVVSYGVAGPSEHPSQDYVDPGYAEATCTAPPSEQ